VAPDAAFLEVAEPRFDECLALGVAVAATAISEPDAEMTSRVARAVNTEPFVSAQGERSREDGLFEHRSFDHGDRIDRAAAQAECQPTISGSSSR